MTKKLNPSPLGAPFPELLFRFFTIMTVTTTPRTTATTTTTIIIVVVSFPSSTTGSGSKNRIDHSK